MDPRAFLNVVAKKFLSNTPIRKLEPWPFISILSQLPWLVINTNDLYMGQLKRE